MNVAAEAIKAGAVSRTMWLVPLLPAVSFVLILFFGKRTRSHGHAIGIAAIAAAWVMSMIGFLNLVGTHVAVERSWTWFTLNSDFKLQFGMSFDFLCAVMFVVVTTVSLLVQIYSTGYMHDDKRYTWFYAILSLFTASMLFLVIANNLLQMLIGWEGVGVCSYLLIGHYWEEKENSSAAMKAFITTRVGDIGFMFGIFVLFIAGHTFNIQILNHAAESGQLSQTVLTAGALLLFCGAVGKSAQFPLHVWLPDAMAGPTPVSALIHAATMVVAGIYLVARMFLVFQNAHAALDVVAVIASITMVIAAALACVQDDIKRVLAYSTISQLGYMMAALGVGAYTAAIFHLFTHAFFKALLFLGAGSLIHSVHSNNMSDMGGLRKYMPHTFKTFIIGSAALAGIFPLAGFFSKDEIIGEALRSANSGTQATAWIVFVSAIVTAFLTAAYMGRACIKTFWGEYRGHGTPHESPGSMVTPLWILAIATIGVGFIGFPIIGPFKNWINVPGEEHPGFNLGYNIILPVISVGIALFGVWLAWQLFEKRRWQVDILGGPFAWFYRFIENKYYLDDIYLGFIVKPIQYVFSKAAYWTNQHILDGVVNSAGKGAVALGDFTYEDVDQQVVDFAVNGAAGITGVTGGLLKYIQSGNIQRYAAILFAATAIFVAVLAITQI
ncbi:MAG: NADH-quinone oxidoreductase subunit L [Actinomycetota bacterium]|nr:NADH-quinone oxidoreductase subunit L [Actinomycetota bacterium]